jgi:transcriptional regulator with XRE-family HTH domain
MEMQEFKKRLEEVIGEEKPFSWASRIGIPGATFSRMWKQGIPPKIDTLEKIALETGVSLDWLLFGEGPKKNKGKKPSLEDESFGIKGRRKEGWEDALVSYVSGIIEDQVQKKAGRPEATINDYRLRHLVRWLEAFFEDSDEDKKTWIYVEMQRVFPEFSEWIDEQKKKRESSEVTRKGPLGDWF